MRGTARGFGVMLLLAAGMLQAGAASADIPPISVEACSGKAIGAACSSAEGSGTCQNSTCEKLRYDCTGVDGWSGSGPCGSTSYDCVRCTEGAASGTAETTGCTARPTGQPGALWGAAGLVGLALLWRERNRAPRRR